MEDLAVGYDLAVFKFEYIVTKFIKNVIKRVTDMLCF